MRKQKNNSIALVIDLEACCWYGNAPEGQYKEIIEIGIACVDYFTKEIVESRSIIVKPQFSEISAFCTKLTTITQELVDKEGMPFKKACKILADEYQSSQRLWFSWGDYDRISMEQQCLISKVDYPFGKTHFNLKEWYAFKRGEKTSTSVSNALKNEGLEFEGQAHRGYVDAYNTAKLLKFII